MEITYGTKIKADEKAANIAKIYQEKRKTIMFQIELFSYAAREAHEDFMKAVYEIHPELSEWNITYHHLTNEITVMSPKE